MLKQLFKSREKEKNLFRVIDPTITRHLFVFPGEEFKNIDFENVTKDRYEISNYGRVYSKDRHKFLTPHNQNAEGRKQYMSVSLSSTDRDENGNVVMKGKRVHRLVAHHFCEPPKEGQTCVNHIDSNSLNNHYTNLEWCTHQENMDHMKNYGNIRLGEDLHNAIFTNEQVHKICQMLEADCYTYRQISEAIGFEFTESMASQIGGIKRGVNWTHISSQYKMPGLMDNKPRPDDEIHAICKMMEQGYSDKEIAMTLYGIEESDKKELSKKYKFFGRLKSRERYVAIVSQYNVPYPKRYNKNKK